MVRAKLPVKGEVQMAVGDIQYLLIPKPEVMSTETPEEDMPMPAELPRVG